VSGLVDDTLWELSTDMFAIGDRNGYLLRVNSNWQRVLGYSWEELSSQPWLNLVHPDDLAETMSLVGQVADPSRPVVRTENRLRCKDGQYRWLSWIAQASDNQTVQCIARDISDLKGAEAELNRSAHYARTLIEASLDPLITISVDGTIMDVNAATERATGLPRRVLIGSEFSGHFTNPDAARAGYLQVFSEGQVTDFPLALRHVSGSITDVLYNATVYRDADGQIAGVFAAARDVTARKRAEAELRASQAQLLLAQRIAHVGSWQLDVTSNEVVWSDELYVMLGLNPDLPAPNYTEHGQLFTPESWEALSTALANTRETGTPYEVELNMIRADGTSGWMLARGEAVLDASGSVVKLVGVALDITARKLAEERLLELAMRDPLTGLANRAALLEEITRALSAGRRHPQSTAVLMMDLDHFKNVNDSMGHGAGDELLTSAAERITKAIRVEDLAARPGGDEFIIVMRDLGSPAEAVVVAERLVEEFRRPFVVGETDLFVSCSIGVAVGSHSSNANDLVREADTAMYAAKAQGRDRVSIYNEQLRAAVTSKLTMEGELRHALELGQLAVWFQPEVDLTTGSVIALEALVRWHHPSGELLTAERFVKVAEESRLITDIGDWVLHQACHQAAVWVAERPERQLIVRVNVSALQLADTGLLASLDHALQTSGLDPSHLGLEITETSILLETATVRHNLNGIRDRGVKIALDDFGQGYASLAYLHRYRIDVMKIDRSFVANLTTNAQARQLITGMLALAGALGMHATAEGVEREDQAAVLRELGCSGAQGYLYSKAVPPESVSAMLEAAFF